MKTTVRRQPPTKGLGDLTARSSPSRVAAACAVLLTLSLVAFEMPVLATAAPAAASSPTLTTFAWGNDSSGQLGDGGSVPQETPEAITLPGGITATAVSAGNDFSLAVGSDGNVYAWGDNQEGQLGDGTTNSRSTPEEITLAPGVRAVSVSAGSISSR